MKSYNNYKKGITSKCGCMRCGISRCNNDRSEVVQSILNVFDVVKTISASICVKFNIIGDGKLYNHNESGSYNKTGWF